MGLVPASPWARLVSLPSCCSVMFKSEAPLTEARREPQFRNQGDKKVGVIWGRMFWVEEEAGVLVSTDSKQTSGTDRDQDGRWEGPSLC